MKAKIEGGQLVLRRRDKNDRNIQPKRPVTVPGDSGMTLRGPIERQDDRRAIGWIVLVSIALLLALVSALALRQNNLNMAKLRDDLVAKDQTGEVSQVQAAAKKLQNYVAHHMNTSMGKVALQTLYDQAAQQAMEASKPAEISTDVYQKATDSCRPQLTNYGYRAWASCVATKVGLNATTTLATADSVAPDQDLYYVEYASTRWSADLAGISLLLLLVILAVIAIKLLVLIIRKLINYFKKRKQK